MIYVIHIFVTSIIVDNCCQIQVNEWRYTCKYTWNIILSHFTVNYLSKYIYIYLYVHVYPYLAYILKKYFPNTQFIESLLLDPRMLSIILSYYLISSSHSNFPMFSQSDLCTSFLPAQKSYSSPNFLSFSRSYYLQRP